MKSAPSVSQADVNDAVVSATYTVLPNGRTTVCQLTLYNGFTVEGMSACVSLENFDAELGQLIAHSKAVEKIWPLLGFRLADQIYNKNKNQEIPTVDPVVLLGEQVWYYERLEDKESDPMVAFVSHVEEGYRVNLTVLAPNGVTHARNDVAILGQLEKSPAGMSYYARRKA
jgi:hypothetical protein